MFNVILRKVFFAPSVHNRLSLWVLSIFLGKCGTGQLCSTRPTQSRTFSCTGARPVRYGAPAEWSSRSGKSTESNGWILQERSGIKRRTESSQTDRTASLHQKGELKSNAYRTAETRPTPWWCHQVIRMTDAPPETRHNKTLSSCSRDGFQVW